MVIILIIAAAIIGYIVLNTKTPEEKAAAELASAVAAVGKLMILPKGDEPVLASVTDAEALIKQQAFFTGSVNGDQLLLYPKNLKAVIYSPSRHMIVNVGPIQSGPDNAQPAGVSPQTNAKQPAAQEVLTVEVRNGTGKPGLAAEVAQNIGADTRYKVAAVSDAKSNDYSKTILYVKDGDSEKTALANALASLIGASVVSEMPKGEKSIAADSLVIVGGN